MYFLDENLIYNLQLADTLNYKIKSCHQRGSALCINDLHLGRAQTPHCHSATPTSHSKTTKNAAQSS